MDRRFDYVGFDFSLMDRMRSRDPEEEEFREGLLESVKTGRITPDNAEERAFDRGLDSLTTPFWSGPSVLDFRAWSIEMTLAWLIWGSKRAVQRFYTPYRIQCFEWKLFTNGGTKGYQPMSLGPASTADVRAKASSSKTRLSFNDAVRNLWDRVQGGVVVGSALTVKGDEFKTISAAESATLKLHIDDEGQACLVDAFRNDVVRYHTVTFSAAEIVAEWASDDADRPLELEDDNAAAVVDPDVEHDNAADVVDPHVEHEVPVVEDRGREQARPVARAAAPRLRGRRAAFAWDTVIRAEALRLLDLNGDFDPAVDPAWRPARLIDNLLQFCQRTWETEPSRAAMTNYVRQYHEEFRQLRAAN
ncbi:hypothetical protein [Rhizobium leguminosarum]|uniref:hypothetical protein n=1 Tax=Rhizobium leguminosarum TaxID=384 RepID=UPI0010309DF7|nr:hypothetical protein [Rhizobium leguminosarum]TAY10393.1 hypothetical protein ELH96_00805 [Rhizobium leguminosarum]